MKRIVILMCVALLGAAAVGAQVPRLISFQGTLRDDDGTLLPDGNYDMTFRIFNVEMGGEYLWEESRTVAVTGSMFSVALGEVVSLDLPFDTQYWIEMRVGTDPWLEPRLPLTAAPYALGVDPQTAVSSLNGLSYAVTLTAGSGVSISQSGQTITIAGAGGGSTAGESLVYPDGTSGLQREFWPMMGSLPYTVPAGKNFYITNSFFPTLSDLRIDGQLIARHEGNAPHRLPIIVGAEQVISTVTPGVVNLDGFLVDATVTPVTVDIGADNYFPPGGQTLVVTYVQSVRTDQPYWDLKINGAQIRRISTTDTDYALDQPIIVGPGYYLTTSPQVPGAIVINGYLR